jgi:hypothetical protein
MVPLLKMQNPDIAGPNSFHVSIRSEIFLPSNPSKLLSYLDDPDFHDIIKDALLKAKEDIAREFNAHIRGGKPPIIEKGSITSIFEFILILKGTLEFYEFLADFDNKRRRFEQIVDNWLSSLSQIGNFKSSSKATAVPTYPGTSHSIPLVSIPNYPGTLTSILATAGLPTHLPWTRPVFLILILFTILLAFTVVNNLLLNYNGLGEQEIVNKSTVRKDQFPQKEDSTARYRKLESFKTERIEECSHNMGC